MANILYLSHTGSTIGGGENRLLDLVRNLDKSSYNPIIVCPDAGEFSDKLRKLGVPVHICRLPGWRKAGSYPLRFLAANHLSKLAGKHHIDLVHTSDLWLNYYAWRAGQSLGIPAISHVRNVLEPENVQKHLFDRFDGIIAISRRTKELLVSGGVPSEKIEVIYDGIDLSRFTMNSMNDNVLRRGYHLREHLVGLIGRIEPFKRQRKFVHIVAEVLRIRQDVSFLIIGEPAENRTGYFHEVKKDIEKYNVAENIVFTGYRRDLPEVLASLDLVVTLSAGSVVIEAMASGLPVIGTELGSALEVIDNGVTGLLLPQDDIRGVSEAIIRLLGDKNVRDEMGKAGKKRAEKFFDARKNAKQVETVYEHLLRGVV